MPEIRRLSTRPYAQAKVIIDNGWITLVSYKTKVVTITPSGWIDVKGLFSRTTRNHISAFVKEYVKYPNGESMTYQELKALYEKDWLFNYRTGEIIEHPAMFGKSIYMIEEGV